MQLNTQISLDFGNRPKDFVPGPPLVISHRTASLLFRLRKGVFNKQIKLVWNIAPRPAQSLACCTSLSDSQLARFSFLSIASCH